jgi:hypothetical protein
MLPPPYGKTTKTELAGGLYHVTSRGDRREAIYIDEEDREKWLEILELFLWMSWIINYFCGSWIIVTAYSLYPMFSLLYRFVFLCFVYFINALRFS